MQVGNLGRLFYRFHGEQNKRNADSDIHALAIGPVHSFNSAQFQVSTFARGRLVP